MPLVIAGALTVASRFGEAPDVEAPAAPTGLMVTPGDASNVLTWSDPGDEDVAGIRIYRSTSSGSGFALIETVGPGVETFADEDLTNGTTYYYYLTAVDSVPNESSATAEASGTPFELQPYATVVASLSPNAYFRMDDASGPVTDASGNDYDSAYHNGITYQQPGLTTEETPYAIGFNGIWGKTIHYGAQVYGGEFSVAMWIQSDPEAADDHAHCIYSEGNDSLWTTQVYLGAADSGPDKLSFWVVDDAFVEQGRVDFDVNVFDGQRHHVVLTGTATSVALYVDGVLVGTGTISASTFTLHYCAVGSHVMNWGGGGGFLGCFQGIIDEIANWKRELTPQEIVVLHACR